MRSTQNTNQSRSITLGALADQLYSALDETARDFVNETFNSSALGNSALAGYDFDDIAESNNEFCAAREYTYNCQLFAWLRETPDAGIYMREAILACCVCTNSDYSIYDHIAAARSLWLQDSVNNSVSDISLWYIATAAANEFGDNCVVLGADESALIETFAEHNPRCPAYWHEVGQAARDAIEAIRNLAANN